MNPVSSDQPDDDQLMLDVKGQISLHPLQYPPYREPSFEVAVETGINIARIIVDLLKKCPPQSLPEQLLRDAMELAGYRSRTEKLVGFTGDSGSGKSTSLNSIMDQPGLAKTEANGTAVTPFAAAYAFRQTEQQAPFTLECSFMNSAELGKYIADLLLDFRRYDFASTQELQHSGEILQNDRDAARAVFEAAFDGMEDFDLEELEYEDTEESREQALDYMQSYIQALDFPEEMQADYTWKHESADADDCQEQQSLLIDRGLWPFVKDLRISADIDILSRGLTLIDLPGFKDINVARVRAARRAMSRCDEFCLVVRIDRVVDDPIVSQILTELKERADASGKCGFNLTIVCTRSADLSNRRSLEKMANMADVRRAQAEIKRVKENQDNMRGGEYVKALKQAEFKLESLMIKARVEKVTGKLKQKYGSRVGTGELKVFCIDNLYYEQTEFQEGRELSGMDALRRGLEQISAESLFKDKDLFIRKNVTALLGSFETWMEASKVNLEVKDTPLLPELDDLRGTKNALLEWETDMRQAFMECVILPLDQATAQISLNCLEVAKQWDDWHWCTKRAFAAKNGNHTTKAVQKRDWNSELLACFRAATAEGWSRLAVRVKRLLDNLNGKIIAPWKSYSEKCRQLNAPTNFRSSLSARNDILTVEIHKTKELYIKEMEKLIANANTAGPGSDIVDCMLETYADMKQLHGPGLGEALSTTLLDRVSSEKFVKDYRSRLTVQFKWTMRIVTAKIRKELHAAFDKTESDLIAIQGRSGETRLFKAFPEYEQECASVTYKVRKQAEELDELAAEARKMAQEQYGYYGPAEM
ncbi:hypothetical protein LTR99_009977 [Exophiala xenobiotica]|uniref:Uncharacterized protein n=1 Tax=Vermiconidia calcicola TaxID=1690605 RepID=A0AAV9PYE4_9PEZI|nr:hypothetical protein LTR92_004980 [Exophiala xenobiotica]KAK5530404.1 hypothetical protein LTR25_008982 [Vermiconidia calcicola]KAK5531567.1 hypothetical protein LTR23_009920 [Chaetothyriales sp. CCFEE 6169]KAK5204582.1 hypothetical protein LTR41_009754 [Exophiala xenobiotica]KAK5264612.1 hypothetical protein LTR96_010092 [Exophiala xenobiotica]